MLNETWRGLECALSIYEKSTTDIGVSKRVDCGRDG